MQSVIGGRMLAQDRNDTSISEEVQNVTERACVGFVDLGVLATRAGHSGELLVLNIEEL